MHHKKSKLLKFPVLLMLVLLLISACSKNGDSAVDKENKFDKIAEVDAVQLDSMIKAGRGRVLFINVWATWCVPCVEEFPDIVRIDEYYSDEDVEIISLNTDFGDKVDSVVSSFLQVQNADFDVYNINDRNTEEIINMLDPGWSGALPASFIFNRNGRRSVFLSGAQNYSVFRQKIDSVRIL